MASVHLRTFRVAVGCYISVDGEWKIERHRMQFPPFSKRWRVYARVGVNDWAEQTVTRTLKEARLYVWRRTQSLF